MDTHREFTEWAVSQGVKINGIAAHKFPGRGLGIIAERDLEKGDTILKVPNSALRTFLTVPPSISTRIGQITIHGLLAASLSLDTSPSYTAWTAVLPTLTSFQASIPLLWPAKLQALLPTAASFLLQNQQRKLALDWHAVSSAFPDLSYETYTYNWLLVNTRTFYFTSPFIKLPKPVNRDDCMALQPFADYFNHADVASADAEFSSFGHAIATSQPVRRGDEIYISYGNHSNDFLLAEYGFVMEVNKWDEVCLDGVLMPLFEGAQRTALEGGGWWGKYVLDAEGVCYRTQVALRLLCLPVGQWQRLANSELEEDDKYQSKVDDILVKVFKSFLDTVEEKLESVKVLDCGLSSQRETLSTRWSQIRLLIITALKTKESS